MTDDFKTLMRNDGIIQHLILKELALGEFVTSFKLIVFRRNDETDKLILLLSEDIGVGEKLCLVDGTKMRGKCLVYDKINERMIRLQC
ncbi:oligohyaluronate lyase [Streptococcus pneumoniae]|nr:oligohyaluronate lyase [Streptococcus pneumoniae]